MFVLILIGVKEFIAMNVRQGIGLLVVFTIYLLIGGAVFMVLEKTPLEQTSTTFQALQMFRDALLTNSSEIDSSDTMWVNFVNSVFDNISVPYASNITTSQWSFYDSTFFCLTVVTTIGYGRTVPTTESARGFCIVYALLGIPLTGIWMAGIGNYFSKKLLKAHEKTRTARTKSPRLAIVISTITYLIPGFVIFLLMPAAVFMAMEDWTYLDGFYYAVVTLTTIGFGDLVAGQQNPSYNWAYRIGIMIWIVFGLGYLSMILNFIAKAMKSKHLKNIERTLTKNLRQTQDAFTKEVDYLIKSMNELIKGKPYVPSLKRRSSCPSLDEFTPKPLRRTLSQSSIMAESGVKEPPGSPESPANFVFDLAMAIACGDLSVEGGPKSPVRANQSDSNNVAQLLTMALLPQIKRQNSVGDPLSHAQVTQVKSSLPFKPKLAENKTKVGKSNSVVGNFLFPFGLAPPSRAPSAEDVLTKAAPVDQKPIDHDKNLFKNMMKRQLERSESNPLNKLNYDTFAKLGRKASAKRSPLAEDGVATTSRPFLHDEFGKLNAPRKPRERLLSSPLATNPISDNSVVITVTEAADENRPRVLD